MERSSLLHVKNISDNLEPITNELKSGFYFPVITVIGFEYKKNSFAPEEKLPSFVFFTQVYKMVKQDIDESHTEAWFERISMEEFNQKINDFCMHSGAETTIYQDDVVTTNRRSSFFISRIEDFLQTTTPIVFELQTISGRSHFHSSAGWGCVLFLFNNTLGKGLIIDADAIF